MSNLKGHEIMFILIGDPHSHRDAHQTPVSSSFQSQITADYVSVIDDRKNVNKIGQAYLK